MCRWWRKKEGRKVVRGKAQTELNLCLMLMSWVVNGKWSPAARQSAKYVITRLQVSTDSCLLLPYCPCLNWPVDCNWLSSISSNFTNAWRKKYIWEIWKWIDDTKYLDSRWGIGHNDNLMATFTILSFSGAFFPSSTINNLASTNLHHHCRYLHRAILKMLNYKDY